jgi:hypothetical protein
MLRALLATAIFLLADPALRAQWKESGWISTCSGIGCQGWSFECATYQYPGTPRFYCYRPYEPYPPF